MFKTAALFVALIAGSLTLPRSDPAEASKNGLAFIGSIRHDGKSNSKVGTSGTRSEESLYFTSQTPMKWDVAQATCIEVLGNDASLVSIESPAELQEVTQLLESGQNPMRSFWSEGKYETGRRVFSWGRGEQFESWVPWGNNEPSRRDANTKVAFEKLSSGEWVSKSVADTTMHGFICELVPGSASEPVPCYNTNDLIMILDSSGSIGPTDFRKAMEEFAADVATAWLGWEDSRLSVLVYSNDVRSVFNFDSALSQTQKVDAIKKAPYIGSGTASHLALRKSYDEFDMFNRTETKNIVFLTDGESNEKRLTKEGAQNLHRAGVRCFAIGIGSNINDQELLDIAGGNRSHVFVEDSFALLKDLLKPITKIVCEG